MAGKIKLKVTVTFEYEADPIHYESEDPTAMAKTDEVNLNDRLDVVAYLLSSASDVKITVTPIT